ncbi:MAG: hypothetical protein R6X20_02935 [Phycisphaerae bacterium]
MKRFPWLLVVCTCVLLGGLPAGVRAASNPHPPVPDPGKGYFLLNEGNSLMGQLNNCRMHLDGEKAPLLPALAHIFGYPEHRAENVGAAGVPIDWIWNNPGKRQEFFEDVAENPITLFTVQSHGYQNRRLVEVEAGAAAQMYRHLLKHHPGTPLLLYQTWPSGRSPGGGHFKDMEPALSDGGGDADLYLKGLGRCIDTHMNPLAHVLRQEFPDKPVYLIPCPQAMAEVGRRIADDGECAGMTHVAELLDAGGRSVHTSRKGVFLTCMVHLASYYRRNPATVDMPVDYKTVFAFNLKEGLKPTGLTPEEGKELARLAWDVVRTYPATTVSDKAFAFDDMTRPRAARITKAEALSAKHGTVRWKPGADDTGVAKQVVYLNGEYKGTLAPDADRFHVGGMEDGETNHFVVRTFDATYNFADAEVEITPPAIQGKTVLLAWDLSPYTLNAKDREPEKYKPATAITVTESHAVGASKGTITYGPGASTAGRPFRHCMIISGARGKSFEAARQAGAYVTFTVAPEAEKTLALKSLVLPVKSGTDGLTITLLTSATGFGAGDAVGAATVAEGTSEVEFPLHRVPALQNVSKPVEMRLYFHQGGHQAYIGHFGDPDAEPDVWLRGEVVSRATSAS